MRRRITAFTVAALLTGAVGVSAQIYAPESLARDFRLEWEVTRGRKGPKVEGYVYNQAMRTADRMRLQIERLDASGKVVGSSTVWVFGTVRPDGRAYFSASVPEAASYRVRVPSFDWKSDGGGARNPVTGADEDTGTSIVDVTDPPRPRYLAHIPGMPGGPEQGGAQMVRVCDRQGKTYVLRTFGNSLPNSGHEVWDATDPAKPRRVSTVVSGLTSTHKNWWECDTGIAYLISGDLAKTDPLQLGPSGWRTWRMTKIYDLSDPAKPVFIRDFGLAGQEPGSTGPIPVAHGVHGPIVLGNRAYFAYGTSADGVLQIVDRQKLVTGPKEPTAANLNDPEISRLNTSPNW